MADVTTPATVEVGPPPASAAQHPLTKLVLANLLVTSLLLASVVGFGSYFVAISLPEAGVTKQAEVKVVAYDGEVTAALASPSLADKVVLNNPGAAKTWSVDVPYDHSVTVVVQGAGSASSSLVAGCAVTVDGVAVESETLLTLTGTVTCTWTNDQAS